MNRYQRCQRLFETNRFSFARNSYVTGKLQGAVNRFSESEPVVSHLMAARGTGFPIIKGVAGMSVSESVSS